MKFRSRKAATCCQHSLSRPWTWDVLLFILVHNITGNHGYEYRGADARCWGRGPRRACKHSKVDLYKGSASAKRPWKVGWNVAPFGEALTWQYLSNYLSLLSYLNRSRSTSISTYRHTHELQENAVPINHWLVVFRLRLETLHTSTWIPSCATINAANSWQDIFTTGDMMILPGGFGESWTAWLLGSWFTTGLLGIIGIWMLLDSQQTSDAFLHESSAFSGAQVWSIPVLFALHVCLLTPWYSLLF